MTLTQLFTNIANAIRSKKGTSGTIIAENFPQEISSIVTPNLQTKSVNITQNGTTTVTPDSGYNGLDEVAITTNVTSEYNTKTVSNNTSITSAKTRIVYWITEISNLDIGNVTDVSFMFANCSSLVSVSLLNTGNITNMNAMFSNCFSLISVPLFDTGKVTTMANMFNGCTSLTTIPIFDTSSVTTMASMFIRATALTDQSLDNILQMCINATSYTDTHKTLSRLGLSNVPDITTRVPQLPHYQAFLDAGWTIVIS